MTRSPLDHVGDVVELRIRSEGRTTPHTIEIQAITVRRAVGEAASATLVVRDGEVRDLTWPISDADTFEPGARITIEAGYGGGESHVLFDGAVVAHGLTIDAEGGPRLEIECRSDHADTGGNGGAPILKITWGLDLIAFAGRIETGAGGSATRIGTLRFPGVGGIDVGSTVELEGVGRRLSGVLDVVRVHHHLARGEWITELGFA